MLIEHLSSPGRPNATASLALLIECLTALGIAEGVVERVGGLLPIGSAQPCGDHGQASRRTPDGES